MAVIPFSANNLHEFGTQDLACSGNIHDETDLVLLDESDNPLCEESIVPLSPMIFLVRTTAAFQTVPFVPRETFQNGDPITTHDFTVDWGDGNESVVLGQVFDTQGVSNVYEFAGDYTVTVTGTCPAFGIKKGSDFIYPYQSSRYVELQAWGNLGFTECFEMFRWSINMAITATDKPDLSNVTDCTGMFRQNEVVTTGFLDWDMSNVTIMSRMFQDTDGPVTGIEAWDVSNVTAMDRVFTSSTYDGDLSAWDVSSVTDMLQFGTLANFSVANYDLMLNAWSLLTVQSGVTLLMSQNYTIATSQAARDILTDPPNNWVISDSGGI